MDPDPTPDPDQTPDSTPFFSDFNDAKKIFIFFSHNLPAGTLSSVFKAKRGRTGVKKPKTYILNVS
jgi:hypothetical protein